MTVRIKIHHYRWCQLFLIPRKRFSEPTHFQENYLEKHFDKIVVKVHIMRTYMGVHKKRSRKVSAYLI